MGSRRRRRCRRSDRGDPAAGVPAAWPRPGRSDMSDRRAPTREQLRDHLVRSRIAGEVATPRASNVGNVHKMLARDPDYWFGVELDRDWTFAEAFAAVAMRVGLDPDHDRDSGTD